MVENEDILAIARQKLVNAWQFAIREAREKGKQLFVSQYADQEGATWDFVLRVRDGDWYDHLVRDSLSVLETEPQLFERGRLGLTEAEEPLLRECVEQLKTSFRARIQKVASSDKPSSRLQYSGHGYYTDPDDPLMVVLLGVEVVERHLRRGTPKKASSGGKTDIKNRITACLPLGAYLGRLNLRPSSVMSVMVSTEQWNPLLSLG